MANGNRANVPATLVLYEALVIRLAASVPAKVVTWSRPLTLKGSRLKNSTDRVAILLNPTGD